MTTFKPLRKAVFPVAGLGTRLLPATKAMPKEMLTILDRPLIQMAVEEARAAGIEEFIFVINDDKDILIEHFTPAPNLINILEQRGKTELIKKVNDAEIPRGALRTAHQDEALGLGHAVWCARHIVGDEPFAVILPDDTVLNKEGCLSQMVRRYNEVGGNIIATCAIPPEDSTKYGILDVPSSSGNLLSIRGLVEKPKPHDAPSNMAIFGRYILQPEIFGILERHEKGAGGEIQLTDAMSKLIAYQAFHGLVFDGERLDCGSEVGFVKAQIAFALKKENLAPEIAAYMTEKLREYYEEQQSTQSIPQKRIAAL